MKLSNLPATSQPAPTTPTQVSPVWKKSYFNITETATAQIPVLPVHIPDKSTQPDNEEIHIQAPNLPFNTPLALQQSCTHIRLKSIEFITSELV